MPFTFHHSFLLPSHVSPRPFSPALNPDLCSRFRWKTYNIYPCHGWFPLVPHSLVGSDSSRLHVALDRLPPAGLRSLRHHAFHAVAAIWTPPIVPAPAHRALLTNGYCPTTRRGHGKFGGTVAESNRGGERVTTGRGEKTRTCEKSTQQNHTQEKA